MPIVQGRRRFLTNAAFAGAAGLGALSAAGLGGGRTSLAAEPPPETTKLTLWQGDVTCIAPDWVALELLHSEGFAEVKYETTPRSTIAESLVSGQLDISVSFIPTSLVQIDAGQPLVMLAGTHIGCIELIGSASVGSTRDLKGRNVRISYLRSPDHIFISMFVAYVGLDPQKDINWVIDADSPSSAPEQLASGKIDAFMTGPPHAQELREKKIGHVLVNTTFDKPWSQYICCEIASSREFVRRHPVATKRAVRALLKATDLCASEPERAARLVLNRAEASRYGWRYDSVLKGFQEISYRQWREYDPEDAVRFHALWMLEVGMIKNSPQEIIARGTDWRFLNELKRELKE
jgi:NitT/TauT family transport system substrate-binding protein